MLSAYPSVEAVNGTSAVTAAATRFAFHESPVTIEVAELKRSLEGRRGGQGFEKLPAIKWMGRIKALGFAYVVASQKATVQGGSGVGDGGAKLTSRR